MRLYKIEGGKYNLELGSSTDMRDFYPTPYGTIFSEKLLDSIVEQYSELKKGGPKFPAAWHIEGKLIVDTETGAAVWGDDWELSSLDCLCTIMNLVYAKIKSEQSDKVDQRKACARSGASGLGSVR